jgi:hypothetical protein
VSIYFYFDMIYIKLFRHDNHWFYSQLQSSKAELKYYCLMKIMQWNILPSYHSWFILQCSDVFDICMTKLNPIHWKIRNYKNKMKLGELWFDKLLTLTGWLFISIVNYVHSHILCHCCKILAKFWQNLASLLAIKKKLKIVKTLQNLFIDHHRNLHISISDVI